MIQSNFYLDSASWLNFSVAIQIGINTGSSILGLSFIFALPPPPPLRPHPPRPYPPLIPKLRPDNPTQLDPRQNNKGITGQYSQ